MKKYLSFYLITVFLLFFACQTDDVETLPVFKERQVNYVQQVEIPGVISRLSNSLNPTFPGGSAANTAISPIGEIDLENIMQVIDTLDNQNYTFLVQDEDSDPFTFTNLIIKKRADGSVDTPYLLEYAVDSIYREAFVESNFSMKGFTGTVTKSYISPTTISSPRSIANLQNSMSSIPNDGCTTSYYDGSNGDGLGGTQPGYPGDSPTSGGLITICVTQLEEVEVEGGEECNPEVHDLLEHLQGNLDGHICEGDGGTTTIMVTRCETFSTYSANLDSNCPPGEDEDVGINSDVLHEYIDDIASDLPPEMFTDPNKIWEWLWKNGYIDPFGAGIIDGVVDSMIGAWSMVEVAAAWCQYCPSSQGFYNSFEARQIREETRHVFDFIRSLIISPLSRSLFYETIEEELSNYLEVLTFQQGSNEALHEYGKLVFQVATIYIGVGEIGALLKVKNITKRATDLIKLMPDDLGPLLVKARKLLDDEGLDISIRQRLEVLQDPDAAIDAVQTSERVRPTWSQIQALFRRGNDFNEKAKNNLWYNFNEVHLQNGKRLDSYDPVAGEIVSRKATDFDNIQTSTFEKYLREIDNKYSPGTVIRSNKYPQLDGLVLQGNKILEVPASNQNSLRLLEFTTLANQYNVTIRFRPE